MITEEQVGRLPVTMVPLRKARFEPDAQARVRVNPRWVEVLAGRLKPGVELDPGVFFFDGHFYYCGDGNHRGLAYRRTGRAGMPGRCAPGGPRDAVLYAAGCGGAYLAPEALYRGDEDLERALALMLTDPEWAGWPNTSIAAHCGVSEHRVRCRKEALRLKAATAARRGAAAAAPAESAESAESAAPTEDEDGGRFAPGEGPADAETTDRREAQLPRSSGKLVALCAEVEAIRGRLSELSGSLPLAAMKVVAQAQEIGADPHFWVDDAIERRAQRPRRR